MGLYRKKPVVIEAIEWTGENYAEVAEWCEQHGGHKIGWGKDIITIQTLEGLMSASPGDMIICGVKEEIYPCRADIFRETYEQVPDNER